MAGLIVDSMGEGEAQSPLFVSLDVFQGPLDLLLRLIERRGVPVTAISVVAVADQYLRQVHTWRTHNLDITADFLVLAARLLLIKSRALLPPPTLAPSSIVVDTDEPDTAAALANQLLIYQSYQHVAQFLRARDDGAYTLYERPGRGPLPDYLQHPPITPLPESVDSLSHALLRCLKRAEKRQVHTLPASDLDLDFHQVMATVQMRLSTATQPILFSQLCPAPSAPLLLVATFLAVLDVVRRGLVTFTQNAPFDDIYLLSAGAVGA